MRLTSLGVIPHSGRIVGEGVLGFGHAHAQAAEALVSQRLQLTSSSLTVDHPLGRYTLVAMASTFSSRLCSAAQLFGLGEDLAKLGGFCLLGRACV